MVQTAEVPQTEESSDVAVVSVRLQGQDPLIQKIQKTVEVSQVQYIDNSVGCASCVAAPSTSTSGSTETSPGNGSGSTYSVS